MPEGQLFAPRSHPPSSSRTGGQTFGPRASATRPPHSYPYVRVTLSSGHADWLWLPDQEDQGPRLRVLLALRGSRRAVPSGVPIYGPPAIFQYGPPSGGGARFILRRQGGRTPPPTCRQPSRDRRPPSLTNFGRWPPLPVNPPSDDVVHTFKRRGPSRRGVPPPQGRAGGSGWKKTEAADEAGGGTNPAPRQRFVRGGPAGGQAPQVPFKP